jgi:hypothetical protein
MACCFLAYHRCLNCYQPNTHRPAHGMLGRLLVHFRDKAMVSEVVMVKVP